MDNGKYLIGQVSEITGVSQKQIRSWEDYLGDVFRIPCGRMMYRYYTENQLHLIEKIKRFSDDGFKLKFAVEKAKETLSYTG